MQVILLKFRTPQKAGSLIMFGLTHQNSPENLRLLRSIKPGPRGQVRVQWLCHYKDPFVTTEA